MASRTTPRPGTSSTSRSNDLGRDGLAPALVLDRVAGLGRLAGLLLLLLQTELTGEAFVERRAGGHAESGNDRAHEQVHLDLRKRGSSIASSSGDLAIARAGRYHSSIPGGFGPIAQLVRAAGS